VGNSEKLGKGIGMKKVFGICLVFSTIFAFATRTGAPPAILEGRARASTAFSWQSRLAVDRAPK
jgi:hypothetical protein